MSGKDAQPAVRNRIKPSRFTLWYPANFCQVLGRDMFGSWLRSSFHTAPKTPVSRTSSTRHSPPTKVEAKYEEIEAIVAGGRSAAQIAADIAQSNAVFILLGENVEQLKHTQNWVTWESGVGAAVNKEIWVFEAFEDSARLSVAIPHVNHHVCFAYADPWLAYIRAIVSSFDDSHILPALSAGIAGGVATENPAAGILIGGLGWLFLAANKQPPVQGFPIRCLNCNSIYRIHREPAWNTMRCPVCNTQLQLQFPQLPA